MPAISNFRKFKLSVDGYVKEDMQEILMDVVWETHWKQKDQPIKISFLFEHKSYPDSHVWIQLGLYMFNAYAKQRLNKEPNHVVIPILVYHDKVEWKVRNLSDLFDLPHPDLIQFIPNFDAIFIDVNRMTDEMIIQAEEAIYLKSTFLLFKYKGENEELLRIIEEVFIFVKRDLNESEKRRFIKLYLYYLFSAFKLEKQEAEKVIKKIPPMIVEKFRNTFDVARDEGINLGELKTKALTSFTSMLLFLRDFPDWTNEQVATYSKLKPAQVIKFRKTLSKKLSLTLLKKEIKKQFFQNIELSKENKKEVMDLVKEYLKK